MILVLDCDVPWIPSVNRPAADAAIYYVDIDPLKSQMQLWHVPARRFAAANSQGGGGADRRLRSGPRSCRRPRPRRAPGGGRRPASARARPRGRRPSSPADGVITPEYLTACVRRLLDGEDAHRADRGRHQQQGGGRAPAPGPPRLGAAPRRRRPRLVRRRRRRRQAGSARHGRWSPSSATAPSCSACRPRRIWVQRRYDAPALTVIYDNRGWQGPEVLHPPGPPGRRRRGDRRVPGLARPRRSTCPAWRWRQAPASASTVTDPAELPAGPQGRARHRQLRPLSRSQRPPPARVGRKSVYRTVRPDSGRLGRTSDAAFTVEATQMLNVYPNLSEHQPTCQVCPEGWLCAD